LNQQNFNFWLNKLSKILPDLFLDFRYTPRFPGLLRLDVYSCTKNFLNDEKCNYPRICARNKDTEFPYRYIKEVYPTIEMCCAPKMEDPYIESDIEKYKLKLLKDD
jgi:hypothetical protein